MKIVLTQDNSPTIYSGQFKAYYHSVFGSVQESKHIFIENGLKYYLNKYKDLPNIRILEIGFGTGLNAFLSIEFIQKNFSRIKIEYVAVEKYPLENLVISELSKHYPFNQNEKLFLDLHSIQYAIKIHSQLLLTKIFDDVNAALLQLSENTLDVVYYDAFAPSAQPEMWRAEIFEQLFQKMKSNAVLVTFCAKGDFKRLLKSIRFLVESPKGAAGKREMTRAIKP